jgi:hypothetical protein
MADIVIETGTGNSPLVISGTPHNYRAEDYPAEQNTTYRPSLSDPSLAFVEDTVSISLKARKLQRCDNRMLGKNSQYEFQNPSRPPESANPFIRTYEQSYRLRPDEGSESYPLTGDRIEISERAYRLIQI